MKRFVKIVSLTAVFACTLRVFYVFLFNSTMSFVPATRLSNSENQGLANTIFNCNSSERSIAPQKIHTQKGKSFKMRGVVFDCVSNQALQSYDADLLDKTAKDIQITAQPAENPDAMKSSFVEIFQKQIWGGKVESGGEANRLSENFKASGPGSSLINTQAAVAILHSVIEKLKVELNQDVIKIADIPCGDMQWISHFLKTRNDIEYTGMDIVPELIQRHQVTYKNVNHINFLNINVAEAPLGQSFDIIFSRQMMQHLHNVDIQRVLYHFSSSGSKYMIATTYSDLKSNIELPGTTSYRFRPINLQLSPFNLVPPTCQYQEKEQKDNYLGMWELPLKIKS